MSSISGVESALWWYSWWYSRGKLTMGRKKSLVPLEDKPLTRKQERFVRELVSQDGLITTTQAATNAGFSASSSSSRAHEMMNPNICPHVCKAIAEYREELDKMYEVGYKRHIRALADIRNKAVENNAYSAAVMAEYRRGQASDLYVNRSEVRHGSIDSMNRETVLAEIRKLKNAGFTGEIIDVTPVTTQEETGAEAQEHRGGTLESDQDEHSEVEDS
jgi:phage terminase small subunit